MPIFPRQTLPALLVCLALTLATLPALADDGPAQPNDSFVLQAGDSRVIELNPDTTYTIIVTPTVDGMISEGHVAVYGEAMNLEDDLKLGSLYQVVQGQPVPIFQMKEWRMAEVRGANKVVLQVFDGAMRMNLE